MQVHDLISAFVAHYDKQGTLLLLDAVLHQRPDPTVDLLSHDYGYVDATTSGDNLPGLPLRPQAVVTIDLVTTGADGSQVREGNELSKVGSRHKFETAARSR